MPRPRHSPIPPPGDLVHSRPSEAARSLCGLPAGVGAWSPTRQAVTCLRCQIEIGRRLITQRWRKR